MGFEINVTAVERVLLRSPLLAAGEFRCPPSHPQFGGGGPQLCAFVTFPRRPVRIHVEGRAPRLVTLEHAGFYNPGDVYTRAAVGQAADESDWLALSPELAAELEQRFATGRGSAAFCQPLASVSARDFLDQRRFFDALSSAEAPELLAAEEAALDLLHRLLARARADWLAPQPGHRPGSRHRRLRLVDDARLLLSLDLGAKLSLADIARRLNTSPGHLARTFRAATGGSLHAHRLELRLRHAAYLLRERAGELDDLALELGFSSHSHFATAFRRHFGVPPSAGLAPRRGR